MPPTQKRSLKISKSNAAYQQLDALKRNRNARHTRRLIFVEGVRAIDTALRCGWTLESAIVTDGVRLSDWAHGIVQNAQNRMLLSEELFRGLSDKDEPSELLAVVRARKDDISRFTLKEDSLVVVCDRPSSPGNLGTIIRSCDAFGITGVIVVGHAVDIHDPAVIRASMGSLFAVPVITAESIDPVQTWSEMHSIPMTAVSATDGEAPANIDLRGPRILALGNEARGLSRRITDICADSIRIPTTGGADSLNLAVAAGIVLYEATRQRAH